MATFPRAVPTSTPDTGLHLRNVTSQQREPGWARPVGHAPPGTSRPDTIRVRVHGEALQLLLQRCLEGPPHPLPAQPGRLQEARLQKRSLLPAWLALELTLLLVAVRPLIITLVQFMKMKQSGNRLSCVRPFATPWTVARQAPLSVGFSRQQHWSGLPCPFFQGSSRPRNWTSFPAS